MMRLSLRKGMKWSDGQPFTADDWIMLWYEDFYKNKDIMPVGTAEMSINGKPGEIVKVDETTVEFRFAEPYPMFVDVLSAFTQIGGGHALGGTQWGGFMGPYVPAHYLKQFHPKFIGADKANEMAKAAGMDGWIALLKFKNNYALNPECPVLTPWRTVTPNNTPNWSLERNPYFWQVDTEGNQLPYIDKIQIPLGENLEVVNLRAIAGEYDEMGRHMDMPQAAGLPREPAEGQLQGRPGPRNKVRRRSASTSTRASRPMQRSGSGSPTLISAARSRWASTVTSSTRRGSWGWVHQAR